jgi:hypothetical protein
MKNTLFAAAFERKVMIMALCGLRESHIEPAGIQGHEQHNDDRKLSGKVLL